MLVAKTHTRTSEEEAEPESMLEPAGAAF
jgi:hypothetical protein